MSDDFKMWAVHVLGPDDMYPCPDKEVADALALVLNRQFERHRAPDDPWMLATVTVWPHGYEAWKLGSEQLCFEVVKP